MNELTTNSYALEGSSAGAVKASTTSEMMISRQAQEVQAAIVIAKRFPRNTVESYNRVMEACKRKKLAENATYSYPRGKERVMGPSIRLAEALAQNWGNIDFGITELEQSNGESQVMAYAWDLETNTRQTKIFTVKHWRDTKQGGYALTDQRDIYELVANQGARRLRACILGVIPGDVVDAAVDQCNKTLAGASDKPIIDLVRDTADIFKREYGVTLEMLEKYIGWKSESFTMQDLIKLKGVYNSLRDGMSKKEEVFDMHLTDDGTPKDAFAALPDKGAEGAQNAQKREHPLKTEKPTNGKEKAAQAVSEGDRPIQSAPVAPSAQPADPNTDEYAQFEAQFNPDDLPFA